MELRSRISRSFQSSSPHSKEQIPHFSPDPKDLAWLCFLDFKRIPVFGSLAPCPSLVLAPFACSGWIWVGSLLLIPDFTHPGTFQLLFQRDFPSLRPQIHRDSRLDVEVDAARSL